MKTKAVLLRQSGMERPYAKSKPLTIETVELSPPGPDEVLVKIAAAGLCHSDLSAINGDRPRPLPLALGHEASGIVSEVGPHVSEVQKGDHVVMSFLPVCGHCPACAEGRGALCGPGYAANAKGTLLSGSRPIHLGGQDINIHSGISAFSEYVVVSKHSVVKVPNELDLTHAALFGCAVMTGVGAVVNTCRVRPGETVGIIGLGGVGLSAVLGAVACGASKIIAIDLLQSKLDIASKMGATHTFLASDGDVVDQIKAVTNGAGVHYAIEFAGSPKAFNVAFNITRRGGTTAVAGLTSHSNFEIAPLVLVGEERTVKGCYMGSCVPSRDILYYIDLYLAGKLPVDNLMSSTGPMDNINEAFDRLDRAEVLRHIIIP